MRQRNECTFSCIVISRGQCSVPLGSNPIQKCRRTYSPDITFGSPNTPFQTQHFVSDQVLLEQIVQVLTRIYLATFIGLVGILDGVGKSNLISVRYNSMETTKGGTYMCLVASAIAP